MQRYGVFFIYTIVDEYFYVKNVLQNIYFDFKPHFCRFFKKYLQLDDQFTKKRV